MTLEEDVTRGQDAERLLNDPILKEAFDSVAVALHRGWEDAPIRDKEGQHELKLMLKLLTDVKRYVAEVLETGKLAAIELKLRDQTPQEFARTWRKSDYAY